jgi:beta-aspartyl-peptidase (threonine type)
MPRHGHRTKPYGTAVSATKAKATIVSSGNGRGALPAGIRILAKGGSALDAVEACARIVEADPTDDTVGYGGLPNVLGVVELDASIVDGTTHAAGSVAALTGFLHPITARATVMERLPHVMLVGAGAVRFAREIGAEEGDLLTPESRDEWIERLRSAGHTPASIAKAQALAPIVAKMVVERGTVNFIAIDERGNVASAVTTSGWGFKYPGRVGDSPIIGAGHYSDTRYGGAACTGFGELAMRNVTTKTAVDRLARGKSAAAVAEEAIADANALVSHGSRLNIVVLAANGDHAAATTKRGVKYAYQSVGMTRPASRPRTIVRRRSR